MSDRPLTYPKRPPFFGYRAIRLALKTCVANEHGADVFALIAAIASTEDAKRYTGPVTYHNAQLLPLLGFAKWERLDAARKAAVASGWLCYCPPPQGARLPGQYWVTIPPSAEDLPDTPTDEGDPIAAAYARGYDDGKAGRTPQPYPSEGYGEGEGQGYSQGVVRGTVRGNYLPIPIPTSPAHAAATNTKPARKPRQLNFTPEDRQLAEWFWQRVVSLQPGRKAPNLDKWADELRLMRERDGRDAEHVKALFERVQRDSFWRLNVLSPDKLREKWDDLQLRLQPTASSSCESSIYRDIPIPAGNGRAIA